MQSLIIKNQVINYNDDKKTLIKAEKVENFNNEINFLTNFSNYANTKFFNNQLPNFLITFEKLNGAYGGASVKQIFNIDNIKYYQLIINHEYVNKKNNNIMELFDTILHELIHLYCRVLDIKEVSNNNRYHNKKFKELAEKIGLITQKLPIFGYNTRGLNKHLQKTIINWIKENYTSNDLLNLFRIEKLDSIFNQQQQQQQETQQEEEKPKNRNLTKYICPCCKTKVRAKKGVNIICGDCMIRFEEA